MFNIPSFFGFRAGGGFDSDYAAILAYATTQGFTLPSAGQQVLQNQLVVDLKDSGIWNKLDTFAVFATDAEDSSGSGTSDFALIDWKRLTQYTAVNSPTFSVNGGFTGDGVSAHISTNFNTNALGINYLVNDASRCFWVDNRGISGAAFEGTINDARNNSFNQNSTVIRINSGFGQINAAVNFSVDEHHAINRTSSTNVEIFTNTTQFSRTSNVAGMGNIVQFVLRTGTSFSPARMRYYAMGASLVSENTDFYNAMDTYLTSI